MILRHIALTVFGLGHLRPAPGTWGSMPPPALALGLLWLGAAAWTVNMVLGLVAAAFSVVCVVGGGWAEQTFGGKDPRQVVADETAGQALALLFLPWREWSEGWAWNITLAAAAFFLFRIMDIAKPPPMRALEKLPGGTGILLDDLGAGVYALVIGHVLARFVWPGVV